MKPLVLAIVVVLLCAGPLLAQPVTVDVMRTQDASPTGACKIGDSRFVRRGTDAGKHFCCLANASPPPNFTWQACPDPNATGGSEPSGTAYDVAVFDADGTGIVPAGWLSIADGHLTIAGDVYAPDAMFESLAMVRFADGGSIGTKSSVYSDPPMPRLVFQGNVDLADVTLSDATLKCGTNGSIDASCLGGLSASGGVANYNQSFSGQTTVVLSHALGTPNVIVACYDGSGNEILPDTKTVAASDPYAVTVTFQSAQTGRCVVNGSQIHDRYGTTFTSQTTVTVAGSAHGLDTSDASVTCYNSASPRAKVEPDTVTIDDSTHDVVITFYAAQSGRCVIQ